MLSNNILSLIYEYDSTYRKVFSKVLSNLVPIYYYKDLGDWHFKDTNQIEDGIHKIYQIDSNILQIKMSYLNNKLHGEHILYKRKTRSESQYVNGIIHGSSKYYVNNLLIVDGRFENGKVIESIIYYKMEETEFLYNVLKVELNFIIHTYYENEYINLIKCYDQNRTLRQESCLKEGNMIDLCIIYDKNGILIEEKNII
jgi:antitoxin component YwqK of YwqJK toxin-antitoxin module